MRLRDVTELVRKETHLLITPSQWYLCPRYSVPTRKQG